MFVPAGLTFAIWGVIYLACIISVILILADSSRDIGAISRYFIIINGLNASWLFAWHYQYLLLSLMIMATLLFFLTKWYLYVRSNMGKSALKVSLEMTSSLYLSWISVATIANFTTVLVHYDFIPNSQSTESLIAAVMLILALAICYFVVSKHLDFIHPLVLAWACYGIFNKRAMDTLVDDNSIYITSIVVLVLSLLISLLMSYRKFLR
jgi:hypothetical protein